MRFQNGALDLINKIAGEFKAQLILECAEHISDIEEEAISTEIVLEAVGNATYEIQQKYYKI